MLDCWRRPAQLGSTSIASWNLDLTGAWRSGCEPGEIGVLHVHAGVAWEGHEAVLSGRRAGAQAIVRTEHLPDIVTGAHQRAAYRAMARQLDRVICVSYEAAKSY